MRIFPFSKRIGVGSSKVAISLPTKNRPRVLGRCIAGLLQQTFTDFELWIVYDGEPVVHEDTAYYLQMLARDHKLIEVCGPGYGQVYAHNLVLYQSGAELILRLDDDTLMHQTALEEMVHFLDTYPGTGAVGGLWFIDNTRPMLNPEALKQKLVGDVKGSGCEGQVYYHPTNAPFPAEHLYNTCLYRAEDMRRAGGWPLIYSKGVHHREETDGTYRLHLTGKKLIVLPRATGKHLQTQKGGIRDDVNFYGKQELDEILFRKRVDKLSEEFMQRRPKIAVWTEHSLSPAGGERHFYSTVVALQQCGDFDVWYYGKEGVYSVKDVKKYFGLEIQENPPDPPEVFDLQVSISHFPITWKAAKNYLAMILFPGGDPHNIDDIVRLYGNSKFTADYIRMYWGREAGVIYPPPAEMPELKKKNLMVVAGWFNPKKGLLSAIEAFKIADLPDWRLVIFGAHGQAESYEERMHQAAEGYPGISIRKEISFAEVKNLVGSAKIVGGFAGIETPQNPYYREHFGMTPSEGMRVGAIPVVYREGGYPESCRYYTFGTIGEAAGLMREIAGWSPKKFKQASAEMMKESEKFSFANFAQHFVNACWQILQGGVRHDSPYLIGEPMVAEPKASIVIPNYDLEQFLPEAIDSALTQTYRDTEIIIVDDGSPGDPEKVVENCGAGRCILIRQDNRGLAHARNVGILVANGQFILPVDADDFLAGPDILAKLIEITKTHPDKILYSDVIFQYRGITELHEMRNYDFAALLKRDFIPPTALFPREAWVKSRGYKHLGEGFEDWEFWITLGEQGCYGLHVDFPIYHYRQRKGSMRDEANAVYEELYAKIKALHVDTFSALEVRPTIVPPPGIPKVPARQVLQVEEPEVWTIMYNGESGPHNIRGPKTHRFYRIRSGAPISMVSSDAEALVKLYPDFVLLEGA